MLVDYVLVCALVLTLLWVGVNRRNTGGTD